MTLSEPEVKKFTQFVDGGMRKRFGSGEPCWDSALRPALWHCFRHLWVLCCGGAQSVADGSRLRSFCAGAAARTGRAEGHTARPSSAPREEGGKLQRQRGGSQVGNIRVIRCRFNPGHARVLRPITVRPGRARGRAGGAWRGAQAAPGPGTGGWGWRSPPVARKDGQRRGTQAWRLPRRPHGWARGIAGRPRGGSAPPGGLGCPGRPHRGGPGPPGLRAAVLAPTVTDPEPASAGAPCAGRGRGPCGRWAGRAPRPAAARRLLFPPAPPAGAASGAVWCRGPEEAVSQPGVVCSG